MNGRENGLSRNSGRNCLLRFSHGKNMAVVRKSGEGSYRSAYLMPQRFRVRVYLNHPSGIPVDDEDNLMIRFERFMIS